MATSQARIDANRQNAQKSTGPRTQKGKEAARRNALTHGLCANIVIPGEDVAEVARLVAKFETDLAPAGDGGIFTALAQRAAILFVRAERSAKYDAGATAHRMRHADADWVESRKAHADFLFDHLGESPETNSRQLRAFPEGVDKLITKLRALLPATTGLDPNTAWENSHGWTFEMAVGRRLNDNPISPCSALTSALYFKNFDKLPLVVRAACPGEPTVAWAYAYLREMVLAEIDALEAHRLTLDPGDADRADAERLALVSSSPESLLARKYEAATERSLHRTLDRIVTLKRAQDHATHRTFDPVPPRCSSFAAAEAMAANREHLPEMAEVGQPMGSILPGSAGGVIPVNASKRPDRKPIPTRAERRRADRKRRQSPQ